MAGATVFLTRFDPQDPNRAAVAHSAEMPFDSIDAAVAVMGDGYLRRSARCVIYPGVALSTYPFYLGDRKS